MKKAIILILALMPCSMARAQLWYYFGISQQIINERKKNERQQKEDKQTQKNWSVDKSKASKRTPANIIPETPYSVKYDNFQAVPDIAEWSQKEFAKPTSPQKVREKSSAKKKCLSVTTNKNLPTKSSKDTIVRGFAFILTIWLLLWSLAFLLTPSDNDNIKSLST